jgi:hypothetical protein
MTVSSSGVKVLAGGVTVDTNGLYVTGGVSVDSLDINTGGLLVVTGGLSISDHGLKVTGGATVQNGGLNVKGGITVDTGFIVGDGMTIQSGGLSVTGGMTLADGDLVINSGTITSVTGIDLVGHLNITTGGIRATGGLSITHGGLTVTSGALFEGAVDIHNGLTVSSGVTVTSDGLKVAGGLTVTGNAYLQNYHVTSDMRLKKDIRRFEGALAKVQKLRGVYFHWNKEAIASSGLEPRQFSRARQLGVLAQEVSAVIPEVVRSSLSSTNHTYLQVDYGALVPVLIEAVRELDGVVADQSAPAVTSVASDSNLDELEALAAQVRRQNAELRATHSLLRARLAELESGL